MKALSLTQPWATLVAIGAKRIETRSWPTAYRGPIAIHAAKKMPGWAKETCSDSRFVEALKNDAQFLSDAVGPLDYKGGLPLGCLVAVARVVGCHRTGPIAERLERAREWDELAFGDYGIDRWAWLLSDVRRLPEPIPCRGALGLWEVPKDIAQRISAGLAPATDPDPGYTVDGPCRCLGGDR